MPDAASHLIVFSDDWGRHPSSCQHLIRHLLPKYPTLWVNTIGTRRPTLSWSDIQRAAGKLFKPPVMEKEDPPPNLAVVSPMMWPGFRTGWQRRFNAKQVAACVHEAFGQRVGNAPITLKGFNLSGNRKEQFRVAITTLPITADLVGKLDVDRWVYYCVDDFSVWPGLDGGVMNEMERGQVAKIDVAVAVSESLQQRLSAMGRPSTLLTHGIDLDHWVSPDRSEPTPDELPKWWPTGVGPIYLFWGLVDARLDVEWCKAVASGGGGTLILVGPQQNPPRGLVGLNHVLMPGPLSYEELPGVAAAADVLVMPYADLPVTRAMQPLKFKEYLAAGFPEKGRPVVVRKLPSTADWSDAADVVETVDDFVRCVRERAATGLPESQHQARARRLPLESWSEKALQFEQVFK